MREQRWWDVWDHTDPLIGVSEDEIAERLLAELRTAVQYRKVSDVPVGVFLSGGIDSSTNAALFSEGETRPVRTFSIGYEGEYQSYQNELHWARRMAEVVGADHHELLLTQDDLIDFLPEMVRLQDEPIADPVCVPVYYVSKLARDNGVIVAQVGEGADELFCGYPWWQQSLSAAATRTTSPSRGRSSGSASPGLRASWQDRRRFDTSCSDAARWGSPSSGAAPRRSARHRRSGCSRRGCGRQFADLTSWDALAPIHERFRAQGVGASRDLNWMTYVDLNLRLPELLLMRVDKMSMGVSLEGRVPFLDHRFVELAMSIPTDVKTRNGTLKHILKRAVRGVIPDELIDRPKQGFGVPVYEWYQESAG